MLGFLAPALWLIWMFSQNEAFVWATSGSLLLSVGGGLVMFARTARRGRTLDVTAATPQTSAWPRSRYRGPRWRPTG